MDGSWVFFLFVDYPSITAHDWSLSLNNLYHQHVEEGKRRKDGRLVVMVERKKTAR